MGATVAGYSWRGRGIRYTKNKDDPGDKINRVISHRINSSIVATGANSCPRRSAATVRSRASKTRVNALTASCYVAPGARGN
jgi:hypothetical protein